MAEPRCVIIKVGGSLYDLPDLGARLSGLLRQPENQPAFLVPGGGVWVDAVRQLDRQHRLGEEACHWLALDAMTLAGRFLARRIPRSHMAADISEATPIWRQGGVPILDARRFAELDDPHPNALPHAWQTTSDAIAARLAEVAAARKLLLLKSITIPPPVDWPEAARQGWVDEVFPAVLQRCPQLVVEAISLR